MVVHHLRQRWSEPLPVCTAFISVTNYPEGDPLAMNREIPTGTIALPKANGFILHPAFDTGYRVGLNLEVEAMSSSLAPYI